MKWRVYFFVLLMASNFCFAQDSPYADADRIGLAVPGAKGITTADVAAYVNKYCKTDAEKVRAIYAWVISHISYSKDSIQYFATDEDRDKLVTTAMRRRKGTCENFAAILNDICKKAGLHSYAIEGYTRQVDGIDNASHAWDAIMINNEWYLFDPTWDAVQSNFSLPISTAYFMIRPADFIRNHIPFDPMLQFLEHPLTFKEFNNASAAKGREYFNYKDSINKYEQDDPYHQYMGAYNRIEKNGAANELVKTKLSQLRLQLEIIYQDKDSVLYNTAVADYNNAVKSFNDFATYRNNRFKPEKTNDEVRTIFENIKNYCAHALSLLKEVRSSAATLTIDPGNLEDAIKRLSAKANEQEDFYKTYTSTQQVN